jgi:hypothetical protein
MGCGKELYVGVRVYIVDIVYTHYVVYISWLSGPDKRVLVHIGMDESVVNISA